MRPISLMACLVALYGCSATAGAARPLSPSVSNDAQPLVAAAEALFYAMEVRDTAAVRRLFVPEARFNVIVPGSGRNPSVRVSSVSEFVTSVGRSTEILRERMWAPRVEVDREFASLWARYDFHRGDRFSHCGVDAFEFVRIDGEWRIVSLSYTVQTEACPSPPDA